MTVDELTPEQLWQSAQWYRALTLAERAALPRAGTGRLPVPQETDRGQARLRTWTRQKPFERDGLFAQRLALETLTEQDLLALLAESAESLRARTRAVPDWLVALREAFTADDADRLGPVLRDVEKEHPLAGCLPSLGPLLARALTTLDHRLRELHGRRGFLPFHTDLAADAFLGDIAPFILFQVSKPVVLELHLARLDGRLRGDTKEARFQDFLEQLTSDGGMLAILSRYPVLARLLVESVDQCADYVYEFLGHLTADWEEICAAFAGGGDPGPLVEVDAGRGDRHRRGRSVLLLRFASGLRLLYKPKPMAIDVHFQDLVSWLNERGVQPALKRLTILDRGQYGWSEFVASSGCACEADVVAYDTDLPTHGLLET